MDHAAAFNWHSFGWSKRIKGFSSQNNIWLGLLPGTWGAPNKGNAGEAEGIFVNAGRMWASALRLDSP